MNAEWLCYVDGQEYGPYTWPQLVQMAAAGNVAPATFVRRSHDSQWYAADQVPGLFGPAAPVNPKLAAHPAPAPRTSAGPSVSASGAMKKVSAAKAARPAGTQSASTPAAKSATLTPPAGMPSMLPASSVPPPEIPRGRVAAKNNAPQPVAPSPAAQAAQPAWIPVVNNEAPSATSQFPRTDKGDAQAMPAKKPDKSKTLVLALGGCIAGVALLGVGALIWKMNQKPEESKPVAAAPVEIPTTEIDPTGVAEEANPTAAVAATTPAKSTEAKPAGKGTAAKGNETKKTPAPEANAAAALLKGITTWKPLDEFTPISLKPGLKFAKLNAWLSADASGRRVDVKVKVVTPAAGEAAADPGVNASVAPAATGEAPAIIAQPPMANVGGVQYIAAQSAPFLFVEITINNPDARARPYTGWNSEATAALLVDSSGKPFTLLPASATPGVKRVAAKEILPGETLVDTLVFAIPPANDLLFRLALPKRAIFGKQTGAWAYEIDGPALATVDQAQGAGGNAVGPGPAPVAPRPNVAIPIPGLQEEPKPAPPAGEPEMKKPPVNPNGPIPIPGLTDVPDNKPAGPKAPQEVPNLNAAPPKKK